MPINQVRPAVTELLFALDLSELDIASDLDAILSERPVYAPAELEAALLSRTLAEHVQHIEQYASSDPLFDQRVFPPSKMKKGWRPRETVVLGLQEVFKKDRVEVGYLREEFIALRMNDDKLVWSRSWNAEFVGFALKAWWDSMLQGAPAEFPTTSVDVPAPTLDSAVLANALRELTSQFCDWRKRLSQKWQPSLGAARRLEALGVPRDVTYHPAFVRGFINQVNGKALPFKDFNFNYILYIIKARETIARIESEAARKREADGKSSLG